MNLRVKYIIGVLAVLGAVYLFFLVGIYTGSKCDYYLRSTVSSPNNENLIKHEHFICESKPSRINVLLSIGEEKDKYNILSAISTEPQNINIKWVSNKDLIISYPINLKVETSTQNKNYGGVNVAFEKNY